MKFVARFFSWLLVAIAVLAVVLFTIWYQPAPAKRAFMNGQVLTMDPSNTIAQAVLIDDGKIVAAGSNATIEQLVDKDTEVQDLAGRTLIPGFIDAHGHFPGTGMALFGVDINSPPIGTITSMDEMMQAVASKVADTPTGEWVLGIGYDDSLIVEKRHPTRAELDAISTEHPIFLVHVSGHLGVANSLALEKVSYDRNTPNPDGGEIVKDPDGEPNGLLLETAAMPVQMLAMNFGVGDFFKMIRYASDEYAAVGVTTAQSGAADANTAKGLELALKMRIVPFRVAILPMHSMLGTQLLDGSYSVDEHNSDMFTVGPIKIISDGSIQGYTGFLRHPYHVPYHGDTSYRGYPTFEQAELDKIIEKFHTADLQIAVHANGDAAIDALIDAFARAQKKHYRADARPIVIHSQMATDDQLDRMKEHGLTPSFFSAHTYYWGDRHRDIFMGPQRAAHMSPTASALKKGVPFSVHLDSPVVPMDPLFLVWSTVNRETSNGHVIGPDQRISPMQALRAVTIDAAWQIFQDDNRGSLEPGKWADMVILSGNPLSDPAKIRDLRVEETIVGGRTIFVAD